MLSVNNWHEYAGLGSAKFTLCNNQGEEIEVMAEEASLSASTCPGPDAGGGLEWALVEKLASEGGAHTAEEYVLMPVRPAADPRKAASQIVHF